VGEGSDELGVCELVECDGGGYMYLMRLFKINKLEEKNILEATASFRLPAPSTTTQLSAEEGFPMAVTYNADDSTLSLALSTLICTYKAQYEPKIDQNEPKIDQNEPKIDQNEMRTPSKHEMVLSGVVLLPESNFRACWSPSGEWLLYLDKVGALRRHYLLRELPSPEGLTVRGLSTSSLFPNLASSTSLIDGASSHQIAISILSLVEIIMMGTCTCTCTCTGTCSTCSEGNYPLPTELSELKISLVARARSGDVAESLATIRWAMQIINSSKQTFSAKLSAAYAALVNIRLLRHVSLENSEVRDHLRKELESLLIILSGIDAGGGKPTEILSVLLDAVSGTYKEIFFNLLPTIAERKERLYALLHEDRNSGRTWLMHLIMELILEKDPNIGEILRHISNSNSEFFEVDTELNEKDPQTVLYYRCLKQAEVFTRPDPKSALSVLVSIDKGTIFPVYASKRVKVKDVTSKFSFSSLNMGNREYKDGGTISHEEYTGGLTHPLAEGTKVEANYKRTGRFYHAEIKSHELVKSEDDPMVNVYMYHLNWDDGDLEDRK